jgi:hypothetical protein
VGHTVAGTDHLDGNDSIYGGPIGDYGWYGRSTAAWMPFRCPTPAST